MAVLKSHVLLTRILLLHSYCFFSSSLSSIANAQSFTPISTWAAASTFIEGKAFYVMAGNHTPDGITDVTLAQTFSIDLSSSWDASSPKYTKMKDGILGSRYPNALMKDGVNWFGIINKTFYSYNLLTETVTEGVVIPSYGDVVGVSAVMDPSTGDMFMPNAFNTSSNILATMWLSPSSMKTTSLPPYSGIINLINYSQVWSENAKSVFLFGGAVKGIISISVTANFIRYNPANGQWAILTPTGGPSARHAACMVPVDGGSKLVVFGGVGADSQVLGDIYTYDVGANTWRRGADASTRRARGAHACAVTGNYLIVHGGYKSPSTAAAVDELTSVYNMATNTWDGKFVALNTGSGPGADTGDGSGSEKSSNLGAIIGGVVAGMAVLAGGAFLLYRRNKKNAGTETKPDGSHDNALYSKPTAGQQQQPMMHHGHHDPPPGGSGAPIIFGQSSPAPMSSQPITTGNVYNAIPPLASGSIHNPALTSGSIYNPQPGTGVLFSAQLSTGTVLSQPLTDMSQLNYNQNQMQPSPTISTTLQSTPAMTSASSNSTSHPSPSVMSMPVVYNPLTLQQQQQQPIFNQPGQANSQAFQMSQQPPQNPQALPERMQAGQQHHQHYQQGYMQQPLSANQEAKSDQTGTMTGYSSSGPVSVTLGTNAYSNNPQYYGPTSTSVWQHTEPVPVRNPQQMGPEMTKHYT
ncbi:Multiple epidermal growth factor-like domains protein 8 [Podila humilis]|nr:Multiple epidermal growth factor-like domains protein 8 [Podila humilis]